MGPDQYRAPDTFGTLGRDQQILALIAVVTALYAAALGGGLIPPVHAALFGFFVPLAGLAMMALILGLSVGRPWAVMTMLVVVFFGLSLSFRVRELGAVGLDWQNGVKLGCWALLCVIGLLRWRSLLPVLSLPVPALFVALGGMALLSATWSQTPTYTVASAMGFIAYLALAAMAVRDLTLDRTISVILWSLFAFVAVSAVGGVITPEVSWMPPSVEETEYRLQGYSGHPNGLGQITGIFLAFAIIAEKRRLIGRILFFALLAFGVGVMIETSSRTILAAVLFAWLVVSLRRSRFALPILASAMILVCGALLVAGLGMVSDLETFFSGLSRTGSSHEILTLTGRTDIWAVAVEKIAEKPLFGWGYNGTEALIANSFGESFYGNPVNAHNTYLQLLLSLGMIGAAPGFFAMFAGVWLFFVRPDDTRDMIVALYLLNGMAEADGFATPVMLLLLFFWAFMQEIWRFKNRNAPKSNLSRPLPTLPRAVFAGRKPAS